MCLLFFALCIGTAQRAELPCATDILHSQYYAGDSRYRSAQDAEEAQYRQVMRNPAIRKGGGVHTLPIVVHIIHDNGPENISDARVHDAIAWLNDAFRNRGYYNPDVGVDTEIEFCLATQDPSGEAATGINRVQSPATDMALLNGAHPSSLIGWDATQYINVWVVRWVCIQGGCGYGGYANFPGAHGSHRDGVVIAHNVMGVDPKIATLVHEMGHYLGLSHTFSNGCKNDDCLRDGDRVCDTPPTQIEGFACVWQYNTCDTDSDDLSPNNPFRPIALGGLGDQPDMTRNYMSYNPCRDRFTQGQKERMRFFLEGIRHSLLDSYGCYPPCAAPVSAGFVADATEVEAGDVITLTNTSVNAIGYQWYIDGSPYTTDEHTSVAFSAAGQYLITLEAWRDEIECRTDAYTILVTVTCPVVADFVYVVDGADIMLEDLSTAGTGRLWTIRNATGDTVFISGTTPADFTLPESGHYTICIRATGEHCFNTTCRSLYLGGSGFCDPDSDDDDDGLVGLFDTDCPCDPGAYQAQCPVNCHVVPDSFPPITMRLKWQSELVSNFINYGFNVVCGDLEGDGNLEVISFATIGSFTNWVNSI